MWPTSGWMMSAACDSNSSRNSIRSWMRSPVAIGSVDLLGDLRQRLEVLRRHRLLQPGRAGTAPARAASRTAVGGLKRPCISSISSASGPIASRTASISETDVPRLGVVQLEVAGAERVDLQRPVAALDHRAAPPCGTPPGCARWCTSRWRTP